MIGGRGTFVAHAFGAGFRPVLGDGQEAASDCACCNRKRARRGPGHAHACVCHPPLPECFFNGPFIGAEPSTQALNRPVFGEPKCGIPGPECHASDGTHSGTALCPSYAIGTSVLEFSLLGHERKSVPATWCVGFVPEFPVSLNVSRSHARLVGSYQVFPAHVSSPSLTLLPAAGTAASSRVPFPIPIHSSTHTCPCPTSRRGGVCMHPTSHVHPLVVSRRFASSLQAVPRDLFHPLLSRLRARSPAVRRGFHRHALRHGAVTTTREWT